jgi:hypothetical protein
VLWVPWPVGAPWRLAQQSEAAAAAQQGRAGLGAYRLRRVRVRVRRGRRGRRGRAAVDNFSDREVKQARGLGGRRRGEWGKVVGGS